MFIHDADRFGLAELHQLRGRVGRYKHRAYCYLLLPHDRPVTAEAAKRLKAIEEFSDLGAGFQIAMRDLEIRGAGNILGAEQSGHIAAVGYEMYCQLLEQAVGELKGEKPPAARRDVHVELGIDAYIPRNYVPSDRQRMEVYRRMARCAAAGRARRSSRPTWPTPTARRRRPWTRCWTWPRSACWPAALGIESIICMAPDVVFSVRDWSKAKRRLRRRRRHGAHARRANRPLAPARQLPRAAHAADGASPATQEGSGRPRRPGGRYGPGQTVQATCLICTG